MGFPAHHALLRAGEDALDGGGIGTAVLDELHVQPRRLADLTVGFLPQIGHMCAPSNRGLLRGRRSTGPHHRSRREARRRHRPRRVSSGLWAAHPLDRWVPDGAFPSGERAATVRGTRRACRGPLGPTRSRSLTPCGRTVRIETTEPARPASAPPGKFGAVGRTRHSTAFPRARHPVACSGSVSQCSTSSIRIPPVDAGWRKATTWPHAPGRGSSSIRSTSCSRQVSSARSMSSVESARWWIPGPCSAR